MLCCTLPPRREWTRPPAEGGRVSWGRGARKPNLLPVDLRQEQRRWNRDAENKEKAIPGYVWTYLVARGLLLRPQRVFPSSRHPLPQGAESSTTLKTTDTKHTHAGGSFVRTSDCEQSIRSSTSLLLFQPDLKAHALVGFSSVSPSRTCKPSPTRVPVPDPLRHLASTRTIRL
ncbi:hypothetical protein QCA50_007527 [Cerrena zonata]|uniref:Uncharacterized protein n=1 Tax=Cerrena zonata TaxID=2478898 RepID=A0AAW0G595_9APHY